MNRWKTKIVEAEHARTVANRKIDIRIFEKYEASSQQSSY